MMGWFMTGIPIAGIVGGPISGWLMSVMGGRAGLANWQWLFLMEGVPSIVLGIVTLTMIVDTPAHARWLTDAEKQVVLGDLEADRRAAGPRQHGFAEAFRTPRVWLLTLIYFCLVSANPTFRVLGADDHQPNGRHEHHDDWPAVGRAVRIRDGRSRAGRPQLRPAAGAPLSLRVVMRRGGCRIGVDWRVRADAAAGVCCARAGRHRRISAFAPFWPMPTMMLAGTGAAAGIALINSIGNLSGWIAPFVVGWLLDARAPRLRASTSWLGWK